MSRGLHLTVAVIGVVSLAITACGSDDDKSTRTPAAQSAPTAALPPASAPAPQTEGAVTEVVNQDPGGSGKYKFSPSELSFKLGETVNFRVTAETEFHTFTVDKLGIDKALNAGEVVTFTFTFDKPGAFELICIPHQSLGMVGKITVR